MTHTDKHFYTFHSNDKIVQQRRFWGQTELRDKHIDDKINIFLV